MAVSSIPVGDDRIDSSYFRDRVLPMVVDSLDEYLQLDMVECPQPSTSNWAQMMGEEGLC